MENDIEKHVYDTKNMKNVLFGLLIGGLTGAAATLLFAPQSGKRLRSQIRQESIQLSDRVTEGIDKTISQVRSETNRITAEIREKVGELKQLGQNKSAEQDPVSVALDTGKSAVEAA